MPHPAADAGDAAQPTLIRDDTLVFEVSDIHQFSAQLDGWWTALVQPTRLTSRQFLDLKQAVMEMGGNALEWGREPGQPRWAQVETRVGPDAITVIVRDRGPGFHASQIFPSLGPDVDVSSPEGGRIFLEKLWALEESLGHRVGWGMMLAPALVDSLTYNDRGNEVALVKRFGSEFMPTNQKE